MDLKVTPRVNARYWVAILIASMCGTNFGDFFPDTLHISEGPAFLILIGLFALVVTAERLSRRGSELYYWLIILVVRGGATIIADYMIDRRHLDYATTCLAFAVVLALLVGIHHWRGRGRSSDLPRTDGYYWLTMLMAGAVGTILGDGVGHAFGAVQRGVPISTGLATLALVIILGVRARFGLTSPASYWIAVVAVRWWGTNVGDISKFLLSLPASMTITGFILLLTLCLWRTTSTYRPGAESRSPV